MPSAVARPAGLATLFLNWAQTSMDTTPHSHQQASCIAPSIQLARGCAFGSVECVHGYRNTGGPIAVFAHLVSQITLLVATISLSTHQPALSEQAIAVVRAWSDTGAGGGA